MTYEEAIKILTELKPIPVDGFKIIAKAYDLAIEALEKQIPKKPNGKFNVPDYVLAYGICPSCGLGVNSDMKFCSECGQAIDWSDDE